MQSHIASVNGTSRANWAAFNARLSDQPRKARSLNATQVRSGIRLVWDEDSVSQALALEKRVWEQKNFPGLENYDKYRSQSRIFAAFEGLDCVGVTRMFSAGAYPLPFIAEMPFSISRLRTNLLMGTSDGTVEELGTTAVAESARAHKTSIEMWRAAFRDAVSRGVDTWGIIMEPERVNVLKLRYGLPFHQLGPAIDYQGALCAAHIMEFPQAHSFMRSNKPDYYRWFVQDPL